MLLLSLPKRKQRQGEMTTWNQSYQETSLPGQVGYPAAI